MASVLRLPVTAPVEDLCCRLDLLESLNFDNTGISSFIVHYYTIPSKIYSISNIYVSSWAVVYLDCVGYPLTVPNMYVVIITHCHADIYCLCHHTSTIQCFSMIYNNFQQKPRSTENNLLKMLVLIILSWSRSHYSYLPINLFIIHNFNSNSNLKIIFCSYVDGYYKWISKMFNFILNSIIHFCNVPIWLVWI